MYTHTLTTHAHMPMLTYKHTCNPRVYTCTLSQVHICIPTYGHTRTYRHTCTNTLSTQVHTHACMLLYTHTCKRAHSHTDMWTHEHVTCMYISIHQYICEHAQSQQRTCAFSCVHPRTLASVPKCSLFLPIAGWRSQAMPLHGIPRDPHSLGTVCCGSGKPSAACDRPLHSSGSPAAWAGHILHPLVLINIDRHLSHSRTVSLPHAQGPGQKASLRFPASCHQITDGPATLIDLGGMTQRTADPAGHKTLAQTKNRSRRASGTASVCVMMVCDGHTVHPGSGLHTSPIGVLQSAAWLWAPSTLPQR